MKTEKRELTVRALFLLLYAGLGAMIYRMYLRQAIRFPGRCGAYESDLRLHIKEGRDGTGYSLIEHCYAFILDTLKMNEKGIGIFLAIVVLATVLVTYLVMRRLAPTVNRYLLHILAFAAIMVMPVYLPGVNPYRYLGMQCGAIWHNTTFVGMRLAAMLLLLFYYQYQERYLKRFSAADFILFTLLLCFVNMMKPNFIVAFAPAMAVMLLTDCIATKGKTLKRQILFGIPVLISLVVVLWEMTMLFPASESSGSAIGFSVAYLLRLRTYHPVISLLQSAAFPLLVLIANYRLLKSDRVFRVSWLVWLFGLLEYLFIHEEGPRKDHGNLSWGYSFCIYLVFVVSFCKYCENVKGFLAQYRESGEKSVAAWLKKSDCSQKLTCAYLVIAAVLLVLHLANGVSFFLWMYQGGTYVC